MMKHNRFKKYLLLFITMTLLFSLAACSGSKFPKAEESLKTFFDSIQKADFKTANTYMKSSASPFEFEDEDQEKVTKLMFSKVKYEILSVEEKGDSATAKVKITNVDMMAIMENMFTDLFEMMMNAGGEMSDEEINQMSMKYLEDKVSAADAPTTTSEIELKLTKNQDKKIWQIENDDAIATALIGDLGALSE